jgi:hypothetical protein
MQKLFITSSGDFMSGERISPNVEFNHASLGQSAAWSVEIGGHDRWAIYDRLQSLAIDCHCQTGAPLTVQIASPQDLIQCWSVMRHAVGADRRSQAAALEHCWQLDVKS